MAADLSRKLSTSWHSNAYEHTGSELCRMLLFCSREFTPIICQYDGHRRTSCHPKRLS